jgi:hypothetical protein
MYSTILALVALWVIAVRLYNFVRIDSRCARISSTMESFRDIAEGITAFDLARAAEFAVLSAQVYGVPDKDGIFSARWQDPDCPAPAVLARWTQLALPDSIPSRPMDNPRNQSAWDSPLVYGVWYRDAGDDRVEAAIVFRGTDDLGDHWSNFRWLTRLLSRGWDQYDLARTVAPAIERFIRERFAGKQLRMVAAGHSLGGGLAQQAAYAAPGIKTVYAFDSSSVTGFYSVGKPVRDRSKLGMRIYRLHERGEILAYLRLFMRVIYPVVERDPQILEVTYNFNRGNAIGQHSIQRLACALIAAHGDGSAKPFADTGLGIRGDCEPVRPVGSPPGPDPFRPQP